MLRLKAFFAAVLRLSFLCGAVHPGLSSAARVSGRAGHGRRDLHLLPSSLLPAMMGTSPTAAVLTQQRSVLLATEGGASPSAEAKPPAQSMPVWHAAAWGPPHVPVAYPAGGGRAFPALEPCGSYVHGVGNSVAYGAPSAKLRCTCGACEGSRNNWAPAPTPPTPAAAGYYAYGYGYGYEYGAYAPARQPAGHGGYGRYEGPSPPHDASGSDQAAPPAVPGRWSSLFAYLDAVVDKVIWPVLLSHMPPDMTALLKSRTSSFTLMIPEYDALAADPAVRSVMSDPYDPSNGARLVDMMSYHLVAGVALRASDLHDGMELENILGQKLQVTKPGNSASFYVDGVKLTEWQSAGQAIAIWLDGVLHDSPSSPIDDGGSPPAHYPAIRTALVSAPGLSGTLAMWDAVTADSMLGEALAGLVAGPFTLLAPSDTALAAYLATIYNDTNLAPAGVSTAGPSNGNSGAAPAFDVRSLPPLELAALLAPLLLTSGCYSLEALEDGVHVATGLPAFGLPGLDLHVSRHNGAGMPVLAATDAAEAGEQAEEATVLYGDLFVGGGSGGGAGGGQGVIHVLDRVLHSPGGPMA